MTKFWIWLQGKKTILVAVAVIALTGIGFWYGKLTPAQALQLFSFAGVAIGIGDKLQRYLPQILVGLQALATAIADIKAGQTGAAAAAIEGAAGQLMPVIAETTGLHVTGDPEHVAAVVDAITAPAAHTFVQTVPNGTYNATIYPVTTDAGVRP